MGEIEQRRRHSMQATMIQTPEPEYHGSHSHAMIRAYGTERPGRHVRPCTLCRGAVDTSQDQSARRCTQCPEFVLCIKCFEVEEFPFPSPQVVVRNPALLRSDDTVCVRTRPRANAYVLCPIPSGELIEVVAYTTTKDGTDDVYFRQQTGGWIRSLHVVCVLPSERSIAQLCKVHFDLHYEGNAERFSNALCLQFMEETNDMMQDSPDFGMIMGYLTLVPLHMSLFGNPLAATSNSLAVEFLEHRVSVSLYLLQLLPNVTSLLEEHLSMSPRQRSGDASLSYQVKMCVRILVILTKLHRTCPSEAELSQNIVAAATGAGEFGTAYNAAHVVNLAASALQRVLSTSATAATSVEPMKLTDERDAPRVAAVPAEQLCSSTPAARQDAWSTWHGDNGCSPIRGVAWYGIELATQFISSRIVVRTEQVGSTSAPAPHPPQPTSVVSVAPEVREMVSVALSAITCAEHFPEKLACHICLTLLNLFQDAEAQHCPPSSVTDLQWEMYNMDVVEVAMRVIKDVRDERTILCALQLLRYVADKNPRMIQLLASVVVGPLLQFLRMSSHPSLISAAFDVCSAFSYNAPGRTDRPSGAAHSHEKDDNASLLPVCTSKLYPRATPFQPMVLYVHPGTGHAVVMCSHCASSHPPVEFARAVKHGAGSEEFGGNSGLRVATAQDDVTPQHKYFACQCEGCRVSDEPAPALVAPPVPMTLAQKLLGMGRILNIIAQRLRTHGKSVVDAAGRLSMLLCCNEELAVALFCALIGESIELYKDGVLAVAACGQFDQVRYLMTLYPNAEITSYLQSPAAFIAAKAASRLGGAPLCLTPQQHSRKETTPSSGNGSDVGLTPSPGTLDAQRSAPAEIDGAMVSQPVRLFQQN